MTVAATPQAAASSRTREEAGFVRTTMKEPSDSIALMSGGGVAERLKSRPT